MEAKQHFNYCKGCGRALSPNYPDEFCPTCQEARLFEQVRDFVRAYDVNEYDVAEHFGISVRVVKQWIKDGRIEYKVRGEKSIGAMFCSRCGAKVNFGTLCPKCLKLLNGEKRQGFAMGTKGEEGRMRFMDEER